MGEATRGTAGSTTTELARRFACSERRRLAWPLAPYMFSPRVKRGAFLLEGLNSVGVGLYFSYLFFHMRDQFGFANLGNLSLCAVNGAVYCVTVWFAGKYAQKHGYLVALRQGSLIMSGATLVGGGLVPSVANAVSGQVCVMITWTIGMSLTWPALEATVSEGEPPGRLQRHIGLYNVIWSAGGAVAYFVGGAMMERLGYRSIFLVPAAIHACQFVLALALEREHRRRPRAEESASEVPVRSGQSGARPRSAVISRRFLRMAWVANPFSYVAVNALVPVIPKLAERFGMGPMLAGFFCSAWPFARLVSFLVLWLWTGWHYRFRWLLGSYMAMAVCFLAILLGQRLWLVLVAQLVFGAAVGLMYYSSLYYSMDVGVTKGEHGGFHEAAIGAGIFTGPAVGAVSIRFFPGLPNMNAWAVGVLLVGGLVWLLTLYHKPRRGTEPRC